VRARTSIYAPLSTPVVLEGNSQDQVFNLEGVAHKVPPKRSNMRSRVSTRLTNDLMWHSEVSKGVETSKLTNPDRQKATATYPETASTPLNPKLTKHSRRIDGLLKKLEPLSWPTENTSMLGDRTGYADIEREPQALVGRSLLGADTGVRKPASPKIPSSANNSKNVSASEEIVTGEGFNDRVHLQPQVTEAPQEIENGRWMPLKSPVAYVKERFV
jgi:hypothetical protein